MQLNEEDFDEKEFIYDWNVVGRQIRPRAKPIEIDDETLRDGLQSPSVTDPTIEEKIELLQLMEEIGIQSANIGLPGAGQRVAQDTLRLAQEIAHYRMKIVPNCACRTVKADIDPVIEISQRAGIQIEAATFIGSSPIRQYAEEWSIDFLCRRTEEAVSYAVKNGLDVMYVTEDTTRSHPETVRKLYTTAIECGAKRVVVCDTVGHAIPEGVRNLIGFVREIVEMSGRRVKIDWHGHRDRGLAIQCSLTAIEAGADRIHATGLGIGERVGNVPMEILLVNLKLMGLIDWDLTRLKDYTRTVARICHVPLPHNYPVFGHDAYRTATGVHAAAVIKAQRKGHAWLADRVYSGVPAGIFGLSQIIEVGPMSGESNVAFWLRQHELEDTPERIRSVFDLAKASNRILKDEEIENHLRREGLVPPC